MSHFVSYPEILSLKTLVPDSTSSTDNKILRSISYKLYGVLVHLGHTSRSGHYYSYIRGPNNNWVKADDSRVLYFIIHRLLFISFYSLLLLR